MEEQEKATRGIKCLNAQKKGFDVLTTMERTREIFSKKEKRIPRCVGSAKRKEGGVGGNGTPLIGGEPRGENPGRGWGGEGPTTPALGKRRE